MMERSILCGIPPITAGLTIGVLGKTTSGWLATGMCFVDRNPEKPEFPERVMELDKAHYVEEAVYYKHQVECALLARAVCKVEGKLISGLVQRMWKNSGKNPDMMKFLFKQYTHAHGIKEPKQVDSGEGEVQGIEDDAVTISLPDNGRGPVTTAVSKK